MDHNIHYFYVSLKRKIDRLYNLFIKTFKKKRAGRSLSFTLFYDPLVLCLWKNSFVLTSTTDLLSNQQKLCSQNKAKKKKKEEKYLESLSHCWLHIYESFSCLCVFAPPHHRNNTHMFKWLLSWGQTIRKERKVTRYRAKSTSFMCAQGV